MLDTPLGMAIKSPIFLEWPKRVGVPPLGGQ